MVEKCLTVWAIVKGMFGAKKKIKELPKKSPYAQCSTMVAASLYFTAVFLQLELSKVEGIMNSHKYHSNLL